MKINIKEEVLNCDISTLTKKIIDQCIDKIKMLEHFPKISNIKHLKGVGSNIYRLRSGDFRILFTINQDQKEIMVFAIKHRKEVYKYLHRLLKRLGG